MTPAPDRPAAQSDRTVSGLLPSQLPDLDPSETPEWRESLDGVVETTASTPGPRSHAQRAATGT